MNRQIERGKAREAGKEGKRHKLRIGVDPQSLKATRVERLYELLLAKLSHC